MFASIDACLKTIGYNPLLNEKLMRYYYYLQNQSQEEISIFLENLPPNYFNIGEKEILEWLLSHKRLFSQLFAGELFPHKNPDDSEEQFVRNKNAACSNSIIRILALTEEIDQSIALVYDLIGKAYLCADLLSCENAQKKEGKNIQLQDSFSNCLPYQLLADDYQTCRSFIKNWDVFLENKHFFEQRIKDLGESILTINPVWRVTQTFAGW